MSQTAENDVRECVECGALTDRWVQGWDDRYRCVKHAHFGPPPSFPVANHCPTCRCPIPPGTQP